MRLLLFCLLLFTSCANIGTLSGGPEDKEPPILLKSSLDSLNFHNDKIVFEFDEYIQLDNAEKNIQILPKHSKLVCSISKKKLIIKLDTLLKLNTTYQIIINKGVKDVNAGNPFQFSTVFSTGSSIDSGKINVLIPEYESYKNLKIALTDTINKLDSFNTFNSSYILSVDKNNYSFIGLPQKQFTVWLFTDVNGDNKPDLYKPINFVSNALYDTTYSITPKYWIEPFKVNKTKTDGKLFKVYYNTQIRNARKIANLSGISYSSLIYVTTDSLVCSSLSIDKIDKIDTVFKINIKSYQNEVIRNSIKIYIDQNKSILRYIKPQQISDSQIYNPHETVFINLDSIESKIIIENDTFNTTEIPKLDIDKFSKLTLTIHDTLYGLYDLKIYKDDKEILFLSGVNSFNDILEPGLYRIELYKLNSIYELDPFYLRKPEVLLYEKNIYLKSSWEENLEIKL